MSKLTPAVGYIRMSSGHQEASPAQQRAEIIKLAKRYGYQVIRWYSDEAISGDDTAKRKGFQRMIADAESKGDFAAILCWDQDRFGRFDSIEAGRWIYPLRQTGVWLVTVAQGAIDWNDFSGRVVYTIQQEAKHGFLIDLSRNVLRGKLTSARDGKGAALPPYGMDRMFYDQSGKAVKRVPHGQRFRKPKEWSVRFVVSQDAAAVEVVRWLFRTYADSDCGLSWLAEDLNRRGVASPTGTTWSIQTIGSILRKRAYAGTFVFGERRYGKYHHMGANGESTRGKGRNEPGEPIVVEGIHDALIDRETFDRVRAKMADRKETGAKPRSGGYLLSGLLRCGHCGGPLVGKGYHGGNVPAYYICLNGNTRPGACKRYQIQQRPIEDYVLRFVERWLLQKDALAKIERAVYRQAKARNGFKAETAGFKAKIDALDRKIAKGNENLLLADPGDLPDLSALLHTWKDDRAALQAKLEAAAANPNGSTPEARAKQAVAKLRRLREQLQTADPLRCRAVVKSMIGDIRLWWEPYGKRNRRLAHGEMTLQPELALLSSGNRAR